MAPASLNLPEMLERLQTAATFPHEVDAFRVIETHISYILLTGPYAYKFKKPVDLGFVDFSTLEKRQQDCEAELRLNRRLAPSLYLDIITITGSPEDPQIEGNGEVLEYAVRMRQFDDSRRLDRLAERDELSVDHIRQLASTLAGFHRRIPPASPSSGYGRLESVRGRILENFDQIEARIQDAGLRKQLAHLRQWSEQRLNANQEDIELRRQEGWIRECHGDLHLGNMVDIDGRVEIFDCLEFSEDLRWIDTLNEIAFLMMDLDHRGLHDFAWRFLNQYLELANDYMGLSLLNDYRVYRAMVRAKVAAIEYEQWRDQPDKAEEVYEELQRYLKHAAAYTTQNAHFPIILMHGLSGSGKSWLAQQLCVRCGAICIRSDIERKRLLGLSPLASTDSSLGADAYSEDITLKTYQRLEALAYGIVDGGHPAIVDATFLKQSQRRMFHRLAFVAGIPYVILDLSAPTQTLRKRIRAREARGGDPSEADTRVLEHQLDSVEPLTRLERDHCLEVDTTGEMDIEKLFSDILQKARVPASL